LLLKISVCLTCPLTQVMWWNENLSCSSPNIWTGVTYELTSRVAWHDFDSSKERSMSRSSADPFPLRYSPDDGHL
jgi:hypothetical protein